MKFRTEITTYPSKFEITHDNSIFSIGSCFADRIGQKLVENKFSVLLNPFGTIFNPISIFHLLEQSLNKNTLKLENEFLQRDDLWYHYNFHSEIFHQDKNILGKEINAILDNTAIFLETSSYLIITLGTAWVYKLIATNEVVANCHKMPSQNFAKVLVSVEEIVQSFDKMYLSLKKKNLGIKIIFTLSPVRHIKDTIPLNSVSKAILRLACHQICEKYPTAIDYFPSFEIMLDDLRDYRFYEEDLLHPTKVAEQYIWEKFELTYFNTSTKEFLQNWQKILKNLQHKPFQRESKTYKNFLKTTLQEILAVEDKIDVKAEIDLLRKKLAKL